MSTQKTPEQEKARDLFLHTDMTQTHIAEQVGVQRKTIGLWARQNNWHNIKLASVQMPAMLVDDMYNEIGEINIRIQSREPGQRFPTPQEAETRRKIIASVRAFKKQLSLAEARQVIQSFCKYIKYRKPLIADQVGSCAAGFLENTDDKGYRPYEPEYKVEDADFLEANKDWEDVPQSPEPPSGIANNDADTTQMAA